VDASRLTCVYIAGDGRSGGTLLGQMLNGLDDFVYAGELRLIWQEAFADNEPCGCGQRFRDCQFWRKVIESIFGGFDRVDLPALLKSHLSVARERFTPLLILFNRAPSEFFGTGQRRAFEDVMLRLCRAIVQVSGRKVIVDSSRHPSQALVLARIPQIELKVIHLVRDSRAVAFSYSRKKLQFDTGSRRKYLRSNGTIGSAIEWDWRNLWASGISHLRRNGIKYALLRYEDLIRTPAEAVKETLARLGMGDRDLSFIKGTTVELAGNHAISGNSVKFKSGAVTLRLDDEWQHAMEQRDRRIVTLLTRPLMRHFGYAS